MNYTDAQMRYIASVDGQAHISAVEIIGKLEAENARLRGIVEKLPKTKDGATVVPHCDSVWAVVNGQVFECSEWSGQEVAGNSTWQGEGDVRIVSRRGKILDQSGALVSECYSTREAAEAARKEMEGER